MKVVRVVWYTARPKGKQAWCARHPDEPTFASVLERDGRGTLWSRNACSRCAEAALHFLGSGYTEGGGARRP
jgi:hypothetical protein